MKRLILAALSIGLILFLGSCAILQEPPSTIYPDPLENQEVYPP
jgi:hypothetical protein